MLAIMKNKHTIIEHDSTEDEWRELRNRLDALTVEQLKQISSHLGIHFIDPTDTNHKEDYIDILDEAYWDELNKAYFTITGKQL